MSTRNMAAAACAAAAVDVTVMFHFKFQLVQCGLRSAVKNYSMCPYEVRHVSNPKAQHLTESHVSQCQPRLLLAVGSWHLEAPPAW